MAHVPRAKYPHRRMLVSNGPLPHPAPTYPAPTLNPRAPTNGQAPTPPSDTNNADPEIARYPEPVGAPPCVPHGAFRSPPLRSNATSRHRYVWRYSAAIHV